MKKLLHERLRETEANLIMLGGYYTHMTDDQKEALADEIERYYNPKPRYEDGEPVDWGSDDIEWDDNFINYAFNAISEAGTPLARTWTQIAAKAKMNNGFVVRKQPKVYDADRIEIKVGERLYGKYGSLKPPIESVYPAGAVDKHGKKHDRAFVHYPENYGNGKEWDYADNLTHREPDSLEKLRDDIRKDSDNLEFTPYQGTRDRLMGYAARLSDLIERGA